MEDPYRLIEVVLHEKRVKIIETLRGEKKYISELARTSGLTRPTVCYHLDILQDSGFVESEYILLNTPQKGTKGKVGSFYKLNEEKLQEALKIIQKVILTLQNRQNSIILNP